MNEESKHPFRENDPKGNPFKVPMGYFEEFRTKEDLDGHNRGFKVPQGYFESFEMDLPEPGPSRVLSLKRNRLYRLTALAAAAILLLLFTLQLDRGQAERLEWSDLNESELYSWLENSSELITSIEIAEVYHDVDLEIPLEAIDLDKASDADLNQYIDDIELEELLLEN